MISSCFYKILFLVSAKGFERDLVCCESRPSDPINTGVLIYLKILLLQLDIFVNVAHQKRRDVRFNLKHFVRLCEVDV